MKKYELVNFCEFDKYATKSYCAVHNVSDDLNLGDITKVNEKEMKPFNMIVGGSPCQDFSVAGKQKGSVWKCKDCGEEYNPLQVHWSKRDKCPECNSESLDKSRSSLLVEWLRVIRANKPNFGIYENVKNIVGKQFKETTFKIFEEELHEYGYNTYWKVLNAKNYGIPQNRERVYLILIKKELDNGKFKFPEGFDNGTRLKDILEDEVDEKYYINTDRAKQLIEQLIKKGQLKGDKECADSTINDPNTRDISNCITARYDAGIQNQKQIGLVVAEPKVITNKTICEQRCDEGLRFFKNEVCGALRTIDSCGDKRVIETVQIKQATKKGYVDCNVGGVADLSYPKSKTRRGRVQEDGLICPTITASETGICRIESPYRIRKLTPKECWRLMGFLDKDIENAQSVGISNAQLYKQAGNSIVVDVLYHILKELYIALPFLFDDLKLSSFFSGIGAFEKALDKLYIDLNNNVNFTQPQVN